MIPLKDDNPTENRPVVTYFLIGLCVLVFLMELGSRRQIWHKGQVSGFKQKVIEMRVDDDQDAIWVIVDIGKGGSCHVGYRSCFYRSIPLGKIKDLEKIKMDFKEKKKFFDPKKIYKDKPTPTEI